MKQKSGEFLVIEASEAKFSVIFAQNSATEIKGDCSDLPFSVEKFSFHFLAIFCCTRTGQGYKDSLG